MYTGNINIFGAYDFRDLPNRPATALDQQTLYENLQAFATAASAFVSELGTLLVEESEVVTESFGEVSGGQYQKIAEIGTMEARRIGGKWQASYPIDAWGDRFMFTQAFLDDANLADVNALAVNNALVDAQTYISEVNRAFLTKENFEFDDNVWPGKKTGTLKCKRLANADAADEGYVFFEGKEFALKDLNHYLVSGSNTLTVGAFTLARDALRKVGHDERIVYLCSKATADAAEDLVGFEKIKDPNVVDPNGKYALVSSPRARGRIAKGEVWEWPNFPDGYVFAFDRTKRKPVRVRVHHLAKYRGNQLVQNDTAGEVVGKPLLNKMYRRLFGTAVANRVNGVVVQLTNGGAYTNPAI
ncbi:MAG TPA: hypothetical protein VK324_05590 [Tepidisphaeraceae bacterium]|nr:hypothetical protein [Tepidisphaeraceae bacterium]